MTGAFTRETRTGGGARNAGPCVPFFPSIRGVARRLVPKRFRPLWQRSKAPPQASPWRQWPALSIGPRRASLPAAPARVVMTLAKAPEIVRIISPAYGARLDMIGNAGARGASGNAATKAISLEHGGA